MTVDTVSTWLERSQVSLYLGAVFVGFGLGWAFPVLQHGEGLLNPSLALMLFATFLQLPLTSLGQALLQKRFLTLLVLLNFLVLPLALWALKPLFPSDPMLQLGLLLALLCPCVDYVVTFTQLGRGDSAGLLAATPLLLLGQMLALPFWLPLILGTSDLTLPSASHFVWPFLEVMLLPLGAAWLLQGAARVSSQAQHLLSLSRLAPVPLTAWVLVVVVATMRPQTQDWQLLSQLAPLYVGFAFGAALLGVLLGRMGRLSPESTRALAFSGATRNALILLPIALTLPNARPLLPAVLMAQTLVELLCELVLIRMIPALAPALPAQVLSESPCRDEDVT